MPGSSRWPGTPSPPTSGWWSTRISSGDFSLFQTLALYLVETIDVLDTESETYALEVATLVESILEDPYIVLRRQADKIRDELFTRLKAEGVPYEERMNRLEEVTYPQPDVEFIERTFEIFRSAHPWVRGDYVRPKGISREIFEGYYSFPEYIRRYGLQRSEGVLLRYLGQFYKTLGQTVPERTKTEPVYDIQSFFRTMIERIDTSLLEEWESLLHPEIQLKRDEKREEALQELRLYELLHDSKAFDARIRAEMHHLVRALSVHDYESAALCVRPAESPDEVWSAERFEEALEPFFAEYEELRFDHGARQARHTTTRSVETRVWEVSQVLVDPAGENLWALHGTVDLRSGQTLEGPLIALERIGP